MTARVRAGRGTRERRPPAVPLGPLRALRAWRRDPLGLLRRAAALGDVVRLSLPRFEAWLLVHPDHVHEVLVAGHRAFAKGPTMQAAKLVLGEGLLTSEGEAHRRQRRLIQPLFHHERVLRAAGTMVAHAERAAERWRAGEVIDVHAEMARLALSIAAEALFATDVEAEEARAVGRALAEQLAGFGRIFSPLFPLTLRLPLPANRRFEEARALLDRTVERMIRERRTAGARGEDLLSLLISAEEEGVAGMDDRQVRDQAMTLLLAGHETTAVALTWAWHLLGRDPAAEARLHEELDRVLGGRPPGPADLPRLAWTRDVVREAMRLYPPAWAIGRRALRDHPVGPWMVPAGAVVVVSPYLLHRDPRWWPEPEAFRPERWARDDPSRPRLAYIPFGAGPRMCVGEPFAWAEATLVLAAVARRWRLRPLPGQRVAPRPAVTLRPRDGLPMAVEPR
ncbi:MAG TPA: cytochrome P450 [Actinomycetota bacterium]|nr:cytochrome P450 [Actinomycetota bacterium]